jgi:hypothetical protein
MPDYECTWWLDGWPTWLGGTGKEWLSCCVDHDLIEKSISGDIALAVCVAEISPLMGVLMGAGVLTFGTAFVALRGLKKPKN